MPRFVNSLIAVSSLLLLSACSASEAQVSTAIALTQAAHPTQTEPQPTATMPPSHTPEPTATDTPTPTATPDLRVINTDPRDLLMEVSDLPQDGRYYLPNSNWITPHRNSEVVSGWGTEEGREYLESTGRVDGWIVIFARGTTTVNAPEEIYNNVVLFETAAGASLVLDEYSACTDPENEYGIIDEGIAIGDDTVICTRQEMQASGRNRVWYRIEFVERNVFHAVEGWGWQGEVTAEFMHEVARTLLEKTSAAPLAEEVTFSP